MSKKGGKKKGGENHEKSYFWGPHINNASTRRLESAQHEIRVKVFHLITEATRASAFESHISKMDRPFLESNFLWV